MSECSVCKCPEAELCVLLKKHLAGPLWKIWTGEALTPEKCAAHRAIWLERAGVSELPEHLRHTGQPLEVAEVKEVAVTPQTFREAPRTTRKGGCGCGRKIQRHVRHV